MKVQNTLVPKAAELGRQGAAVCRQVVCQLLPVEGNGKIGAAVSFCLGRQIGQNFVPQFSLGNVFDFIGQANVFVRKHGNEVLYQPRMKGTGRLYLWL